MCDRAQVFEDLRSSREKWKLDNIPKLADISSERFQRIISILREELEQTLMNNDEDVLEIAGRYEERLKKCTLGAGDLAEEMDESKRDLRSRIKALESEVKSRDKRQTER